MFLTTYTSGKKCIVEKLPKLSSRLQYTCINVIDSHIVVKKDPQTLTQWHDRLGHPGLMMMRKLLKTHMDTLKGQKILQISKILCEAYSLGKLITRPSPAKIKTKSPSFLECVQGDICKPIHPLCGPF